MLLGEGVVQTTPQPSNKPSISDYYWGYPTLKKGAWAKWKVMDNNGNTADMLFVYAGKENINGKEAEGFERKINVEGEKIVGQVWYSIENGDVVKYVIKYQGQVICYTPPQFKFKPSGETPPEYNPEEISKKPDVNFGTFTTESGKTVKVVKFSEVKNRKRSEVWLSSEVPFGIVKMVSGGETFVELKDFGLSGGKVTITKEEVENCMSISNIPGGFGG